MPPAKTIKLILALIIFGGLIVIVGATVNRGTTAAPPAPITRQILRRKDKSKLPASAAEIAELRKKGQEKDKRELKTREFKDMPLKFHAIRNVDSETWYKDLQIEVKNVGTKPIYFILAYLEFPNHKPGGRDTGVSLTFGDLKNWDIGDQADPQDQHLEPGQTYVFTIPEKTRPWLGKQHERVPQEFKKLDFHIDIISFGDGTGFEIGRPIDLRKTKQPDEAGSKKHHHKKLLNTSVRSPPQDGCGSCGRYTTRPALTCFDPAANEWCEPAPLIKVDSSRSCRLYRTIYKGCYGDDTPECPEDVIYDSEACPGYSPTPSPSPSPTPNPDVSPVCNPATKPNNDNCNCVPPIVPGGEPFWYCFCSGGVPADYIRFPGTIGWAGCDPNKSANNHTGCCICNQQQCPDGSTATWNCECPTPTPTPDGGGGGGEGGGGGGDPNSPPAAYTRECIDYVWVHFVSYDGGQTWHYDDRESYAGCYYIY
jgi:hypothetical protein